MKRLKTTLTIAAVVIAAIQAYGFCGFYVAKADADLFNESSQVIIVNDGNRSVITMANDFNGDVKDFAMVVPVPEVLKEENIRIAEQIIFDKLDAYSAPRIVEYHDTDPCQRYLEYALEDASKSRSLNVVGSVQKESKNKDYKVTIEAQYTVGEYDILILSARESQGLKSWLVNNGYKIPESANEVLDPYIKNDLKFFVVKVNLEKHKKSGYNDLRPLQIAFESDRFMLPIRLGMANSKGNQDLIVYAFSKTGRVETVNYRTVKLPTDKDVPVFVKDRFDDFYVDLFQTAWQRENEKAVFLEYSWDLSSTNFVKCDPCASTPPAYADLREAGVFWVSEQPNSRGASYVGDVYFTRLHVRYNREHYPQDLAFQHTPNKQNFQGRYVIRHPVSWELDCDEANDYYKEVAQRREKELHQLASLTGWDISKHKDYVEAYASKVEKESNGWIQNDFNNKNNFWLTGLVKNWRDGGGPGSGGLLILCLAAGMLSLIWMAQKVHRKLVPA